MNKYVCYYELYQVDELGEMQTFDKQCEGTSLFNFKDGFWINGEGKLTREGDYFDGFGNPQKGLGKYWIQPARIYYVEKVEVEE